MNLISKDGLAGAIITVIGGAIISYGTLAALAVGAAFVVVGAATLIKAAK